jgi:hypothetical protein
MTYPGQTLLPSSIVSALESLGFPFFYFRDFQALAETQSDSRCGQRLTGLFFILVRRRLPTRHIELIVAISLYTSHVMYNLLLYILIYDNTTIYLEFFLLR